MAAIQGFGAEEFNVAFGWFALGMAAITAQPVLRWFDEDEAKQTVPPPTLDDDLPADAKAWEPMKPPPDAPDR